MPGKVLIVDDIATNRVILQVKLTTAGYTVLQANNANDALQLAREAQPDLMLCSARLDGMSAETFHQAFENDPRICKISRIVLCELSELNQRTKLLSLGATDVFARPVDIVVLLARFRAILRNRVSREDTLLQESASRVLGFGEAAHNFAPSTDIALICETRITAKNWLEALPLRAGDSSTAHCFEGAVKPLQSGPSPDVITLEIRDSNAEKALTTLSDLRAASRTRYAKIIAVLDSAQPALLCEALNRGADDVLVYGYCADELALRLRRQAAVKQRDDKLRENMHEGLRAAATDALTGLYNRRFALPHLARMASRCDFKQTSCAVMVIDVDHFKLINDTFGHEAGDAALVTLSELLRRSLRRSDLASRIGGEEFMIVSPDTCVREARLAAHRLCKMISSHSFILPGTPEPQRLTVSIGVAVTNTQSRVNACATQTAETLLREADQALYGSKNHGRNQVTLSPRSAA
ncbi:diguanylate cyclase [Lentibacter algarum]|uniref:diguanylate cyclase n=1 Tax=Lentibacter algarum TaxID=576131 RepID=UPI001C0803A0|nr:diguanylate cyclase [Lentibacter algarum]MBU2982918.1 diguanylate cyclase [Lentibacter algarum]